MGKIKRLGGLALTAVFFVIMYFLCVHFAGNARAYYVDSPGMTKGGIDFKMTSVDKLVESYVNTTLPKDTVITGTGDIMFYSWQLDRAYDENTQTYDFSNSFQYITKYFKDSHYVVGNLETTMAGKDNGKFTNLNGYSADVDSMNFNTPESAAAAMAGAGFKMVSTANEHAFDSGTAGLKNTLSNLKTAGLDAVGTASDAQASKEVIKNINGLKVGFAAFTNVLNDTGEDTDLGLVNYLNHYSEEAVSEMCAKVAKLKQDGAEAVAVILHYGEEYKNVPDEAQKDVSRKLLEAGADVIFGSHPHVLMPIEVLDIDNGDGTSRKGAVIYSMGNFLSSQQFKAGSGINRDIGGIFDVVFTKKEGKVSLTQINLTPTFTNWTEEAIAVIPVCEAHDNQEAFSDILDRTSKQRINTAFDTVIPEILNNSGLSYTYSDYKYKISLENS